MPPRKSTSSTAAGKSPARSPSTSSTSSTPSKPRARSRSTSTKKSSRFGKLSEHKYLTYLSYAIAAIFILFGLNAIFRPKPALTFFELDYPILPKQQIAVDVLSAVYGARDTFVGAAILIAARHGNRNTLGALIVSASALGFFDGAITALKVGKGQWNHFGYAPLLAATGALLLGVLDGK